MRYLLFKFSQYYPSGGWNDFRGAYNTIEEAEKACENMEYDDYYQIVDTHTMSVVKSNE